jgi:hypothetical protein
MFSPAAQSFSALFLAGNTRTEPAPADINSQPTLHNWPGPNRFQNDTVVDNRQSQQVLDYLTAVPLAVKEVSRNLMTFFLPSFESVPNKSSRTSSPSRVQAPKLCHEVLQCSRH